jgi:hypothetical protein
VGSASGSASASAPNVATQLHDALAINYLDHLYQGQVNVTSGAMGRLAAPSLQTVNQTINQSAQQGLTQVQNTASTLGVTLSGYQPATHEVTADNFLGMLQGKDYDQAYLDIQKLQTQSAINTLQQLQGETVDPQVTSLITSALATEQSNLSALQSANTTVPSSSSAPGSGSAAVSSSGSGPGSASGSASASGPGGTTVGGFSY